MTQELADKLIAHYELAVSEIDELPYMWQINDYLHDKKIINGICHCANHVFGENIYDDEWVNKQNNVFGMWYTRPVKFDNKHEIIYALKFRIDRLKTFKEPCN